MVVVFGGPFNSAAFTTILFGRCSRKASIPAKPLSPTIQKHLNAMCLTAKPLESHHKSTPLMRQMTATLLRPTTKTAKRRSQKLPTAKVSQKRKPTKGHLQQQLLLRQVQVQLIQLRSKPFSYQKKTPRKPLSRCHGELKENEPGG